MWNASRMIGPRSLPSFTRKLYLVHGRVMPTLSASWKASLPIRCVGTWPVKATIGIESIRASCSAVTRLVAAGPEVTRQTPTLPGGPRVALGGVAGGRLLADQDVAQALEVVEHVVDRQHGAAGQAEDEVDAFALQSTPARSAPLAVSTFAPSLRSSYATR